MFSVGNQNARIGHIIFYTLKKIKTRSCAEDIKIIKKKFERT